MNYPEKSSGVSVDLLLKLSLEGFYRGFSQSLAWIPAKNMRE